MLFLRSDNFFSTLRPLLGLFPRPLLTRMEPAVTALLERVHDAQAQARHAPPTELVRLLADRNPLVATEPTTTK